MDGLESMIDTTFWDGKRVFITGSTGFKGSWLSIWLNELGSKVYGYSLEPPTNPSIFALSDFEAHGIQTTIGNIQDTEKLTKALQESKAEILFHLAAQPIVRTSYEDPVGTYLDNVVGTAKVLEAARHCPSIRSIVCITTDKCYQNNEWHWGYRENDALGGFDPYSASKACAEIVCASYRQSFFNADKYGISHSVGLASARAGNVIGGGDWAKDRLIPDIIKAFSEHQKVVLRNPGSIRPWQHVLEPLHGYLSLAEKLYTDGASFSEAWNFGPDDNDARPVSWIVERLSSKWTNNPGFEVSAEPQPHEANYLKLDCSKARNVLGWHPIWDLETALKKIVEWVENFKNGKDVYSLCAGQIHEFLDDKCRRGM